LPEAQFVEPQVSRAKFEREIAEYREHEHLYRARGILLVKADFPVVIVALAAPQLSPPAIVTGALFDYTNYDTRPPSVRLVNPFTGVPYMAKELPTNLPRATVEGGPPSTALMAFYSPDDIPFLCLAGVREYHDHPGHSGNSWELYRASGAGRLVRLLDHIVRYGVESISAYHMQINIQPVLSGFLNSEFST
jgi:hypothetical protein